jgi:coiled-coil domain-containing protein 77
VCASECTWAADDFEAERADLLRRISSCSASATEAHNLRCASQKRAEEVRELQQALSAAHMHLFEERDTLLRLQAENDELRLQEAEDRRRLQHLMSLTHPVDQEVTLSKGVEPMSGLLYPSRLGTNRQGEISSSCT